MMGAGAAKFNFNPGHVKKSGVLRGFRQQISIVNAWHKSGGRRQAVFAGILLAQKKNLSINIFKS